MEFLSVAVISCSEVYALEAKEGKELKGKMYRTSVTFDSVMCS